MHIALIGVLLAVFVPERQTIMLIAASEIGESLALSDKGVETGNKAYQALQKWLDTYLEESE